MNGGAFWNLNDMAPHGPYLYGCTDSESTKLRKRAKATVGRTSGPYLYGRDGPISYGVIQNYP